MRVRSVLVRPRVDLANVLQLRVVDRERALRPLRRHRDVRPVRHQLLVPQVPRHLVDEIEYLDGYIMLMLVSRSSRITFPYISLSRFLTLTYMEAIQETNDLKVMVNLLLSRSVPSLTLKAATSTNCVQTRQLPASLINIACVKFVMTQVQF